MWEWVLSLTIWTLCAPWIAYHALDATEDIDLPDIVVGVLIVVAIPFAVGHDLVHGRLRYGANR